MDLVPSLAVLSWLPEWADQLGELIALGPFVQPKSKQKSHTEVNNSSNYRLYSTNLDLVKAASCKIAL